MKEDVIEFEILADGSVKMTTGKISGSNHSTAESLSRVLQSALGGETTIGPGTKHEHGHHHTHGEGQHEH